MFWENSNKLNHFPVGPLYNIIDFYTKNYCDFKLGPKNPFQNKKACLLNNAIASVKYDGQQSFSWQVIN